MMKKQLNLKETRGITLLALVITVIILLILAGITIGKLTGKKGLVRKATDAEIKTELSQLKDCIDKYKAKGEGERIKRGDYSGEMSNDELKEKGVIVGGTSTEESLQLGIVKNFKEIKANNKLGKNGEQVNDGAIYKNVEEIKDLFAIDLINDNLYYIDEGKIWSIEGQIDVATLKGTDRIGPKVKITPNEISNVKEVELTFEIIDQGDLSVSNEYEYYLSTSSKSLKDGEWLSYENGTKVTIGGTSTTKYVFIKRIKDASENENTEDGTTVEIGNIKYQRYGPYVFNYETPKITIATTGENQYPAILTVTATSKGSNIQHIELPDGTIVEGSTNKLVTTYNATKNGPLTFKAIDETGEEVEVGYTVENVIEFITEWTITEANTEIKLPITNAPNIYVDWGDGTKENITTTYPTHTYTEAKSYDIKISGYLPYWVIGYSYNDDMIEKN